MIPTTRYIPFLLLSSLLTLLTLALLSGCSRRPAPDPRLVRAESLMDEHPDSALTLLESMDATAMTAGSDSSLYRLLIIEAHCKNHLSLEKDSLTEYDISNFRKSEDYPHLSKAYYYAARRMEFAGDLRTSLVLFIHSKHIAESIGDCFRAAMAASGIGDISTRADHAGDALRFYSEASDYMRGAGNDRYLGYALVTKAYALSRAGRYEEAETILRDSIDTPARKEDPYLDYSVLSNYGAVLTSRYAYKDAISCLEKACSSEFATSGDS